MDGEGGKIDKKSTGQQTAANGVHESKSMKNPYKQASPSGNQLQDAGRNFAKNANSKTNSISKTKHQQSKFVPSAAGDTEAASLEKGEEVPEWLNVSNDTGGITSEQEPTTSEQGTFSQRSIDTTPDLEKLLKEHPKQYKEAIERRR